jgi:hypothetical protein
MGDSWDEDALYDEDGYPISHSIDHPGQITIRPKGAPPPSGLGWRRVWDGQSKNWDEYYRGPIPPKDGKSPGPPTPAQAKQSPPGTPSKAPSPLPPAPSGTTPATPTPGPPDQGSPSTSPGTKAIEKIEKDFSGDEEPGGLCIKCILRGFLKGAAIAAAIMLFLALLPEELAAIAGLALFGLMVKGVMDLIQNWDNMSSEQKQEALAEIAGGLVMGGIGAKVGPKPGSLAPKAPRVGVTPDGVPMPVPDSGPAADSPMEMGGGENSGGGGDDDFARGPGGARKHDSHGSASDKSGAGQRRKAGKQDKMRKTQLSEQQALQQATAELEKLKQAKSPSEMDMILDKKHGGTEEQWIRQRQLQILGRRD